nr:hypothetical protein [Anaerolineae bacterium]
MADQEITAPTPPVGVIESLSSGFEITAGHLGLLLLPLLLDLLLWVGPRLSMRPAMMFYYTEIWEPAVAAFDQEIQATFEAFSEMIWTAAQELPDTYMPYWGLPTLLAGREAEPLPFEYQPPTWEVRNPLGLFGFGAASIAGSLLLFPVYISLIAELVKNRKIRPKHIIRRYPLNLFWLIILCIVVPILILVVYLPFLLLAAGFALFSALLAVIIDWAGRFLILWILLYLVFTIHGIFINDRGGLGAMWDSIRVVQWNMSSTMFLVLLVAVLSIALTYIWQLAPTDSWLAPVGIAGNAFISTGLITATFVYFKDRYRYWRESRAELLAELDRRKDNRNG